MFADGALESIESTLAGRCRVYPGVRRCCVPRSVLVDEDFREYGAHPRDFAGVEGFDIR
jgi:hypothetical protein